MTSRKREVFVQYAFTVSNGGYVLGQQNMKSFSMPRLRKRILISLSIPRLRKRILIPPPILTACVAAGVKHEQSGWPEVPGREFVVTVHILYRYRAVLAAVREVF